MRALTDWADLHKVEPGQEAVAGALDPEIASVNEAAALMRVGAELRGLSAAGVNVPGELGTEGELRLAGQGCFMVEEFAVCELAAVLGMSEPAARGLVGQSLELRDRLPRLWGRVMEGRLPAWRGRAIARETIPLSAAAAAYVDAQLAPFAHKLGLGRVIAAVQAAALRFDPELAAERSRKAAERRGVWVDDELEGTSSIHAIVDTLDAAAFDAALSTVARTLGNLGDPDSYDVRRARAIGVLADPQGALDLAQDRTTPTGGTTRRTTGLHIHLHTAAVDATAAALDPVARVDGSGPRPVEAVRRWIAGLAPAARVTITPVVDLNDWVSVDAYEAPKALQDQVDERDLCCAFPWCGRKGRKDRDHIEEYVPPDCGGPPGQTNTRNLASLCRFHHRVKTHSAWVYRREPNNSLTWTSPLGLRYRVDGTGTTRLH
jgi:hypothetical protein